MRKTTLFYFLLLTINLSFAQILFEDDFDGSGPGLAGWNVVDLDGNTPNTNVSQFTSAWIEADDFNNTGDIVAMSTSWYTPAGTSNDWMITPAINLTTGAILTWEDEAQDASYPDGYEVLVSTTGNTPADFTDAPVFSVASASPATWAMRTVDLSAYNNQTVYIAWRNNSTDQFILMINNVLVEVPPSFDAEVIAGSETQDQYTQVPFDQIAPIGTAATINNVGGSGVTNATVTLTVTNSSSTTVYTETSSSFSIAGGASQAVTFTGFTPTTADTFTSTFNVTISETDGDIFNNSDSKSIEVTTGIYARDDDTPASTLGIGANNGGFLGQQFDIFNAQDLNSVTFSIGNTGGEITGLQVRATIWDFSGGVPSTQIANTDFATVTATANDVYTVNITGGPINLAAGTYLVAVEEPDTAGGMPTDENVQVVTTNEIFTTGAGWVNWPTNPNGTWSNSEDFNFFISYYIRPNFQSSLSTEENKISNLDLSLYPNPASDVLYIKNPTQLELQSLIIKDITGRIIQTIDLDTTTQTESMIDVSFLSTANYFATITSKEGSSTIKFIVE